MHFIAFPFHSELLALLANERDMRLLTFNFFSFSISLLPFHFCVIEQIGLQKCIATYILLIRRTHTKPHSIQFIYLLNFAFFFCVVALNFVMKLIPAVGELECGAEFMNNFVRIPVKVIWLIRSYRRFVQWDDQNAHYSSVTVTWRCAHVPVHCLCWNWKQTRNCGEEDRCVVTRRNNFECKSSSNCE